MQVTVIDLNLKKKIFAVHVDIGEFTVLELRDAHIPKRSDIIEGDFENLGLTVLNNLSQGKIFTACVLMPSCNRHRTLDTLRSRDSV